MHGIARLVYVPLRLFGADLSITNEVVLVWLAGVVTVVLLVLGCRRTGLFAGGFVQQLFEALIEFVEREVVGAGIGRGGQAWVPFLLSLFFFILFANLLGVVPAPSFFKAATSNINVTATLAVMVFLVSQVVDIRRHGLVGFLRKLVPHGVPVWAAVLLVPIEVVTRLARPVSLAVRLFANMLAGHAVLFLFVGFLAGGRFLLAPFPLAGAVVLDCFEIFVCFLQAFIFVMLTAFYVREALEEGEA